MKLVFLQLEQPLNLRFQNWGPIRDAKMASMLSALTVA